MKPCTCSRAEPAALTGERWFTQPRHTFLDVIDSEPFVGETPPPALQSWITPNPLFYVRNHFPVPSIDPASWSISIEGQVSQPIRLTYSEVRRLPRRTIPVTLECAGNDRSDLDPPAPGNRFRSGAVSTAIWAGAPLKTVLERAGMRPHAKEVLFEGADSGEPGPGEVSGPYLRSLPIQVALHPDTLLAYEMNGELLSPEHGSPVRLIVPDWYAVASVKWLSRIVVLDHAFEGFFQTRRYVLEDDTGSVKPLSRIFVKSIIGWPRHGEVLTLQEYPVTGLAWSGDGRVTCVELSHDAGATWRPARLEGPDHPHSWRPWTYHWDPSAPGHYTLMARATDEKGNSQPLDSVWNSLGYAVNGIKAVCVTLRR